MSSEHPLLQDLRIAASELEARLFRNNTGTGWVGKFKRTPDGDVIIKQARPLHAGIGTGGSDLIGWTRYQIKPEDVGKQVAVFTAAEAKTPGVHLTKEQEQFIRTVQNHGGIAGEVRSVHDLDLLISTYHPKKRPGT